MKQNTEIDGIIRELTRNRDQQLGRAATLTPERQAWLAKIVAEEFPLEATFRRTAVKRDESLQLPSRIPLSVEMALQTRLAARNKVRKPIWASLIRSPLAAVLTACALITGAIVFVRIPGVPSRPSARIAPQSPRSEEASFDFERAGDRLFLGRAELFSRTALIQAFDLNKAGPASLQASFFTSSAMDLADGDEALPRLRLDLPVTAIRKEEGFVRTP